jgi:hypothetical protein
LYRNPAPFFTFTFYSNHSSDQVNKGAGDSLTEGSYLLRRMSERQALVSGGAAPKLDRNIIYSVVARDNIILVEETLSKGNCKIAGNFALITNKVLASLKLLK